MTYFVTLAILLACTLVSAKLPEYITVCHKTEADLDKCILNSINLLKPRLRDGLPELSVPGLEPLFIPEAEVANGKDVGQLKILGKNLVVSGASSFKVNKLRSQLDDEHPKFFVDVSIPAAMIDGDYLVNAKILVVSLNGNGKIHCNATNINAEAVINGIIVKKGGEKRMQIENVDVTLEIEDFDVQIDHIFGNDPTLSEVTNRLIRENKVEFKKTMQPIVAKAISKVVINLANQILKSATYDELFPN